MSEGKKASDGAGGAASGRDPDVCVVTCAVTGVLANRKQCPGIPYTPVEIAEETKRAYDAGASVVHIHARQADGSPTFDPKVFADIKREIQARCPILLNFSTGTILDDVSEQCAYLEQSRPEIGALNMGTMNYAKYSENRKQFVFDMVFPNTYGKIVKLLEAMNRAGVKPELECFDVGHTAGIAPLVDMGLLKGPLQFSFIVNVLGGAPAMVETLQLQTKVMPKGSEWGHRHLPAGLAHARPALVPAATSARASRITCTCRAARWRSRPGARRDGRPHGATGVGRPPWTRKILSLDAFAPAGAS